MSFNSNFYNNICGNFTFQRFVPNPVPPPPPPPTYFIPSTPAWSPETLDADYVKDFESKLPLKDSKVVKPKVSICQVREQVRCVVLMLNDLNEKQKTLQDQIGKMSDEEWSSVMKSIKEIKVKISNTLSLINGPHLDVLRKLLAKRTAKRMRLKRLNMVKKKEKEARIQECKEKSRKIDENLQKIKDEINKVKQEEEAKIQADIILKEVLRKKHDAKRCIVKLDALAKLRRARQNTAKGRGESVSDSDTLTFNSNIEKLKSLWSNKLILYEKEEADLRAKLDQDTDMKSVDKTEMQVSDNLQQWREHLFGGKLPQVDFGGDIERFVAVRSRWDHYINDEGTPLPVGWVVPLNR